MYCVMRASVPSLYNVYRRYDTLMVLRYGTLSTDHTCTQMWAEPPTKLCNLCLPDNILRFLIYFVAVLINTASAITYVHVQ